MRAKPVGVVFVSVIAVALCMSVSVQAADITARLDSADGGSAFIVQDSNTNELLRVDSQGVIQAVGPLTSAAGFVGDGAGLTNLLESDPVWSAVSNTVMTQSAEGATAYGWGNHAVAGYADSNLVETTYVKKAGDTMTGALIIDAQDGLVIGSASNNVMIGRNALGDGANIAIGADAHAQGLNRIAIGAQVTNTIDNTARLRGKLYLDGGGAIHARPAFGVGQFQQLLPIQPLHNVIYVATNGTISGPGTIDRPYDTPQRGYNAAAVLYTNTPATVVIAAGNYAGETLNMHKGNIHVIGHGHPEIHRLNVQAPAAFINGKQRVENLIVRMLVEVQGTAENVKLSNCRLRGEGLLIYGSGVEVHNCFVSNDGSGTGLAVIVGMGMGVSISDIALYHSSFYNNNGAFTPTLRVEADVENFQVVGCQIVNDGGGRCIEDMQATSISPLHLYTHNYLRALPGALAVADPLVGFGETTIAFTHNTVLGNVGLNAASQYYANNIVYGFINSGGIGVPAGIGWTQAGTSSNPADNSGNIEHDGGGSPLPVLPAAWLD